MALLFEQHPNAFTELDFRTPFELLAATIMSAQSTDKRVNEVTPALFKKYPDARAMAQAPRRISSATSRRPASSVRRPKP